MEIDPRYFDYAASSPVWPEALDSFVEMAGNQYANPSSRHGYGLQAREKLLELKKEICDAFQFYDGRLLLCSSASEANNMIIEGHLSYYPNAKLLVAEDVHDSLWYITGKRPRSVKTLKINAHGIVNSEELEQAIQHDITMVCISHVCHETGAVHPVKEFSEICYRNKVRILVDGVQAAGHIPVNLNEIPCTYYTLSGHKFGSVRSTAGALIRDSEFSSLIQGGKQEWNLRAGTENIAGLASMLTALKKSIEVMDAESKSTSSLVDLLKSRLNSVQGLVVNTPDRSMPGILSLSIPGIAGRELVGALSLAGFAISTGSACQENEITPSRIIVKMGKSTEVAKGTVRISMGRGTTKQAVNELAEELLGFVTK